MTVADILQALDHLSYEELRHLRQYIERREWEIHPSRGATPEERIQRMESAAAAIREGFSNEEWDEIERAMTV